MGQIRAAVFAALLLFSLDTIQSDAADYFNGYQGQFPKEVSVYHQYSHDAAVDKFVQELGALLYPGGVTGDILAKWKNELAQYPEVHHSLQFEVDRAGWAHPVGSQWEEFEWVPEWFEPELYQGQVAFFLYGGFDPPELSSLGPEFNYLIRQFPEAENLFVENGIELNQHFVDPNLNWTLVFEEEPNDGFSSMPAIKSTDEAVLIIGSLDMYEYSDRYNFNLCKKGLTSTGQTKNQLLIQYFFPVDSPKIKTFYGGITLLMQGLNVYGNGKGIIFQHPQVNSNPAFALFPFWNPNLNGEPSPNLQTHRYAVAVKRLDSPVWESREEKENCKPLGG